MTSRFTRTVLAALGLGLVVAGCQEQLTAPGSCPATCPGGTPVLRDTVLEALSDQDSLFTGFSARGATQGGLLAANGLNGRTDHAVMRFVPRPDSVTTRDTADPWTTYTIDSVAIVVTLLARDTTVSGVVMELHRLPVTVDTNSTFAEIDPLMVPGTLIDSVTIADTVRTTLGFKYRFVFQGDTLSQVDIPPADSGVLAVGLSVSGATASGVRIGGLASGGAIPLLLTYVTANTTDTTPAVKHQVIQSRPEVTTFVSSVAAPPYDPNVLAIGTAANTRAHIRFPWPAYLKDTVLLARATLELVPESPINGLSGDPASLDVHAVRNDFGAKSPLVDPLTTGILQELTLGSSDTTRVDVIRYVRSWQRDQIPFPPLLVVLVSPAGSSFTEPRFYSTRSPVAARRPRLRITYQLPFDFERP